MSDPRRNIMTLFCEALECPSAPDRDEFLARECGSDVDLLSEVQALLRAHLEAGNFMAGGPRSAPPATSEPNNLSEAPGTLIGPYKLLEQIGEGGFGVVFMAEQLRPIRRKVALKLIKPGMDSRQVIARFEAERQALALMDHPNIASVLDAGETPAGRPFFVMELVRGMAITEYGVEHQVDLRQRLQLFLHVCQAVEHAHQKGIIHRDIKPSNVLVTLHDGTPVVKIIDFGIAKAIGQQLTERSLFTNFAQMIGTPLYMSPEQAAISALDVDTRSDIYSLGVLLYELLTGTTPFDKERLRSAAFDEIRRIIREEEPVKPSTRISTLRCGQGGVQAPQGDPRALHRLFEQELDWIAMRALEKDRARRYQTAGAFAADVRRYLNDDPVEACPPSKWYRFRKFARKNKTALAMATIVLLSASVGLAQLAISYALVRQEQFRTGEEKTRAEAAQERAEEAKKLAEQRAEQIRRDLSNLTAADALLERSRWYAGETRWDDAYAALTKAIDLRPDHASLWAERGDLLALLGLWNLAAADFSREMELRQPDVTRRYYLHALLRLRAGDMAGYQSVRRRARERFGGTTKTMLAGELLRLSNLAADFDDPQALVKLARNLADGGPRTWLSLYSLGISHYRAGQHDEAIRRLLESLDADPECVVRCLSYPVLAMAYYARGDTDLARQALSESAQAVDRWTEERYQAHGGRWVTHRGAAAAWPVAWWDWLEFELYYREAKKLIDGTPPPYDPRLRVLRARALAGLRWDDQASAEYAQALQERPNDPRISVEAHRSRGYIFVSSNRAREAAAEFDRASELEPDDVDLWRFRAITHLAAGDSDAYRRVCQAMIERFGTTEDSRVACIVVFACVLRGDAQVDVERLMKLAEVAAPYFHWGAYVHAAALYRAGRCQEAVDRFRSAAKVYQPRAWDWSFLAMAQSRLGQIDDARRSLAEAARWIDDANRAGDDLSGTSAMWDGWSEKAVYPLLLEEAKTMID